MSLRSPPLSPQPISRENSKLSSQARNPISLRLYKVLGTSFNDEATKKALRTLSNLYANSGTTSTVSSSGSGNSTNSKNAPVSKILDDFEDDEDEDISLWGKTPMLNESSGLSFVETFPGESAAKARKNLRQDMERKLAEGSRQFLRAFGKVDEKLDELQAHVASMRAQCDDAERQLQLTNEASKTLLERAAGLRRERQEVETRQSIVTLFLTRFTINDEEVEALTSRDVPVGPRFFAAMDKTEKIRTDCRVLMAGEEGPTQAGLDIISSTSTYLEEGYEKALRWCSYEFRQLGRELQVEVSSTMREAVRRLRQRPELLNEALTFLSQTRQSTILSSFMDALTRGGPSGLPRPIELHAHDPMRYVGDMLAWVHQCIAAEREFLEGLFGVKGDGRMVGSIRKFEISEEEEWIRELMDSAVTKLCVPLKVRVQQTVRSQESSIVLYKIANLLQFYMLTMLRTIGEEALLSKTLKEITDVAYKVFYDAIQTQARALLRVPLELDDLSVTPPLVILDHTQILREIMIVYDSSLLGDEAEEERKAGFKRILDVMVDPTVQMCASASEEKQRMVKKWDMHVFVLNCLTYLQSVLEPYSFTVDKQHEIEETIDECVSVLAEEHYENILNDTTLSEAVAACEERQGNEPLSHIPATQPARLLSTLHNFSLWLSSSDVVQSPRLGHLTQPRLNTQIHHAALARLAKAYEQLCEEVKKPENKYEAASTLLGTERPFGQVHLLWQIFGLQEGEVDTLGLS